MNDKNHVLSKISAKGMKLKSLGSKKKIKLTFEGILALTEKLKKRKELEGLGEYE